jgi:hypothetical protein
MGNIFFLTKAKDLEEAEYNVNCYFEDNGFWSYSSKLPELSGPLALKHEYLVELNKSGNWKKRAEDFLILAEKYKAEGNFSMYGRHLIYAGEIYTQTLTFETVIFNIESEDYSIPTESKNWWAISLYLYH